MAKKDFDNILGNAISENITPAASLLRKSKPSLAKPKGNINKKLGRPTKNPDDKKTIDKKIAFSPNEIKAIKEAGIRIEDLSTILRMELINRGANIGIN